MRNLWQYRDEHGRTCTKCRMYKPWSEYNKGSVHGHKPMCRACQRVVESNYKRDPEKLRANSRRWYDKHKKK